MSETNQDWKTEARRLRDAEGLGYVSISKRLDEAGFGYVAPHVVRWAYERKQRAADPKAIHFRSLDKPAKRAAPPARPKAGERQPHIDAAVQAFLNGEITRAEMAYRLRARE